MNLARASIGDLFTIHKGRKPESIISAPATGSRRLLQINDLRGEGPARYSLDRSYVAATSADILIAWDGANAGTVGYGLEGSAGSTLAVLRAKTSLAFTPYVGRFLQSCFTRLNGAANGAAVPHVNRKILEELTLGLPSIAEQQRVSAMLDKADAIRRKRAESLRLLDELLRSVFLEMFGDPVRNEKGWEMVLLGSLATIRRGASPRPIELYLGGSIPWVKIGDATASADLYIRKTVDFVTEAGARKSVSLAAGAIIIANSGVSLGFARILAIAGCIHDGWLAVEDLSERVNKLYFIAFVNQMTSRLRASAPAGTQPNLNIGIVQNMALPVPPIELQEQFARVVGSCDTAGERIRVANRSAVLLCDSMAQRAFEGAE